jgi:hypothetical protein
VGSGADLRRGRIPGERNGAGEERGKEAARHTLFILAEIQVSVHGYPGSHRSLIEFDARRIPMVFGLDFYVPILEIH